MSVIRKNFKDKHQAVEYTKDNLENLVINLTNVSEDVVRAYAELKHIPVSLKAIDEDDYMNHCQMLMQILELINISEVYLSDIKSDIDKYFRPDEYQDMMKSKVIDDIKNHLYDYVDAYSHDVDVVYHDNDKFIPLSDLDYKPVIKIDDGHVEQIKIFK